MPVEPESVVSQASVRVFDQDKSEIFLIILWVCQAPHSPEYDGDQAGREPDAVENHFIIEQNETIKEMFSSYYYARKVSLSYRCLRPFLETD